MPRITKKSQYVNFISQKNTTEEKEKIIKGFELIQNIHQTHTHYQMIDETDGQEYYTIVNLFNIIIKTLNGSDTFANSRIIIPRINLEIHHENISDCLDHIMTLTRPQIKQDPKLRPIPEFMKAISIDSLKYLAYTDCDSDGKFTGFLFLKVYFYQRSLEELEKYKFEMEDHESKIVLDENGEEINLDCDYLMYGIYPINLDQPENINLGLTMGIYVDQKFQINPPTEKFTYHSIIYETWLIKYDLKNNSLSAAMSCPI